MSEHFTGIDWLVVAAYFAASLAIGFAVYRRTRNPEAFTAARRSLPGWVCGLSIFATYVSSISFLALPGKAFASNWNPFVFSLSLPLTTWIAVRYFLPWYRKGGDVSAYAHLEHRFGPWARAYAGFFYLLTQLARMGTVLYLMALPMSVLMGWDLKTIILVTGVSVTLYSLLGGIVAVIWTDALQAVVLIVGAVACAGFIYFNMPEGPGQVFSIAAEQGKFNLGSFGPSLTESTFWVTLTYGIIINLQNFGIDQNYVQRYIASRSDGDARRSVWLGGLLYVPVSAVFFLIGTGLFAFYQTHPEDISKLRQAVAAQHTAGPSADSLTVEQIGDKALPFFIGSRLPRGLTGLVIAGIFAAAMSTISTCLNSSATLLLTEVYRRYIRPAATDRQSMLVLYITSFLWGGLGTAAGLALIPISRAIPNALDTWWLLSGIFSGGMLGLFLLGRMLKRPSNTAAIIAVVVGVLAILWMSLSPRLSWMPEGLQFRWHPFLIPVFGTAIIFILGLLLTMVLGRNHKEHKP
jgi:solute:Na+ symporter, SSS family